MAPVIIPAILWIGEHVLGPLETVAKDAIGGGLRLLPTLASSTVIGVFEKVLGTIADDKKAQLNVILQTILGQDGIQLAELASTKKWYQFPHEILEMAGTIYLGVHCVLLTLTDLLMFIGFEPYLIPTPDLIMFGMVMSLMGVYVYKGGAINLRPEGE